LVQLCVASRPRVRVRVGHDPSPCRVLTLRDNRDHHSRGVPTPPSSPHREARRNILFGNLTRRHVTLSFCSGWSGSGMYPPGRSVYPTRVTVQYFHCNSNYRPCNGFDFVSLDRTNSTLLPIAIVITAVGIGRGKVVVPLIITAYRQGVGGGLGKDATTRGKRVLGLLQTHQGMSRNLALPIRDIS
jgi:hypothetical protein